MVDRITGPIEITNATMSGNFYAAAGSITNGMFSTNTADRLDATKADHQRVITYTAASRTTEVSTIDTVFHVAQGAGTIIAAYVVNETAPAGGDKGYTVDIEKATNASGSFASILSSAIASPADFTVGSGTLSTTSYAQYDRFRLDLVTSGSTGTNGLGVTVCLVVNEAPS